MIFPKSIIIACIYSFVVLHVCFAENQNTNPHNKILPGAYQMNQYLPAFTGKRVAVVANHTSVINAVHLVDTLVKLGINVEKIFSPEHGFRGNVPDGEEIKTEIDAKTGLKLVSLYGEHKKPTKADLQNIDIVIFDIQDVGVRFYTYISTLSYVMEACAENNVKLIVLDRPNPNGFYIDGPVLQPEYTSFVGMHTVPMVYGMTIGEYALMVNGEGWLKGGVKCDLTIITCEGYTHDSRYKLPINPSPNLQDMTAVYLYPSLCLFEGTTLSIGRGTTNPFHVYGHPLLKSGNITFKPSPIAGISENPPLKGQLCYGVDVSSAAERIKNNGGIELSWLLESYKYLKNTAEFFNPFFNKLAGNSLLRDQIETGKTATEIKSSWEPDLEKFRLIRSKYLLYK